MTKREQVQASFIDTIQPFISRPAGVQINAKTDLVSDLQVNSARMVDILLETEDKFGISINDASADRLRTVGDAVDLILGLSTAHAAD